MREVSSDIDPLDVFHELGKVFPDETSVVSVPSNTPAVDALRLMLARKFSQLPVTHDDRILGVFSLWSLAQYLGTTPQVPIGELLVEDLLERPTSVTVEHSIDEVINLLERHEFVLVESRRGLQAIATAIDLLRYFYKVARPYVLLSEIELSLRALIQVCIPQDKLSGVLQSSLEGFYQSRRLPTPRELHDMTFEDYRMLIGAKDNWPFFEGILGKNRQMALAKMERVRDIRNSVFHFRGEVTVWDHQTLSAARDWLLEKARKARPKVSGRHQ